MGKKKNDCLIEAHKPIAANLRRFTGLVSALLNRADPDKLKAPSFEVF
jgi:hypothetical protein